LASGCGFYVLVVRGFSVEMGGLRLMTWGRDAAKRAGGGWGEGKRGEGRGEKGGGIGEMAEGSVAAV